MRLFSVLLLILTGINCFTVVEESASLREFIYGTAEQCEYDNWVSHVSEGVVSENYNLYAPFDLQSNDFGSFNQASTTELNDWATVIGYFLNDDLETAEWFLQMINFPYQIVEFFDTDTDRTYYILRELLNNDFDNNGTDNPEDDEDGSFDFGWGIFIYNPEASNPIIVTVVHPCDDYIAPPMAVECFQEWDAMFLQINGAGREVVWTEVGSYTNTKSLSDPSRNTNHAYNQAYYLFCDKIRENFGRREFSSQIHSYDWSRHSGYANCQISAGYSEGCPNLPIRDMSDLKLDLINASSHLIHAAGSIGNNIPVYLNDFYSIHYNEYDFYFTDEDTTYSVNNDVDLVGYSQNRQMLYSFSGWNSYDVFEPFFHLEMDELPNCYSQVSSNLNWFYAFDTETGQYDMDQIYNNTINYYRPYVEAVSEVLPAMFEMNDEENPPTPSGLYASYMGFNNIEISWEPVSSYDFKTYEIYYNTDHVTENDYTNFDRLDEELMASPDQTYITIPDLSENQQYYFIIRAIDYNDNYSLFSPEVYAITAPAVFRELKAIGEDDESLIAWELDDQSGVLGYRIYRKTPETEYSFLDDYHNNQELLGGSEFGNLYQYIDTTAENEIFYTYRISAINQAAFEYIYDDEPECSPREIFYLEIYDNDDIMLDSVAFSANPYASDNYDEDYDIIKPDSSYNGILSAAFYESSWNEDGIYLSREIMGIYDPDEEYETWTLKLKSHLIGEPLSLRVSENYERNVEKLYIYSYSSGEISNLAEEQIEFTVTDTNYQTYTLIWGDLLPNVYFTNQTNKIYQENDSIYIDWNINYPVMVDHVDLFVSNYEDSIRIASDLPGDETQFSWVMPADVTMHNARFGLDIYTVHDEFILRTSPFILGILPLEQTLTPTSGWQLVNNPWVDNPITISEDFINRNELYKVEDNFNYVLTDTMNFGEAYWFNTLSPTSYTDNSLIRKNQYFQPLEPGWNLIANPHLCTYEIEDLKFEIDGDDFTFYQSVRDEFVSRAVYSYRTVDNGNGLEGSYELITEVQPYESFLVYCYADMLLEPYCIFVPYYNSYFPVPDIDSQVVFNFSQELGDSDELVLGMSHASIDEFEYEFDLPEPPVKPVLEAVAAYFLKNTLVDTTFQHEKLNWEYRPLLSESEPDETAWDFALDVNVAGPVVIEAQFIDLLPIYTVNIQIGAFQEEISDMEPVTFVAQNAGHFVGTITISNGMDRNEAVKKMNSFSSYPNPFNPETTFKFSLVENSPVKLEIYNIRGQKVKTLQDGILQRGDYKLAWNGTNNNNEPVASGLYFARFKTAGREQVTKLLLLK